MTDVQWNEAYNHGGSISDPTFTKTNTTLAWNTGCATTGSFTESQTGSVTFTTSNNDVMAGLSETRWDGTTGLPYEMSGSYLMYKDGVYEDGLEVHSFTEGTDNTFKVEKADANTINYYLNGSLEYVSTNTTTKTEMWGVTAHYNLSSYCTMTKETSSPSSSVFPPPPIAMIGY